MVLHRGLQSYTDTQVCSLDHRKDPDPDIIGTMGLLQLHTTACTALPVPTLAVYVNVWIINRLRIRTASGVRGKQAERKNIYRESKDSTVNLILHIRVSTRQLGSKKVKRCISKVLKIVLRGL